MHLKYFVGGVNGVGKTTLLKAIAEIRPDFRVVKGSELLMKWLNIPGDYEALRALPQEIKQQEWWKCLFNLYEEIEVSKQNLLLDAHYLNLIHGETEIVTDIWMDTFDVAVLVTATPEEVLRRIEQDTSRDRALFANRSDELAVLNSYMQATEAHFEQCMRDYEISHKLVIAHHDGATKAAALEFLARDAEFRAI